MKPAALFFRGVRLLLAPVMLAWLHAPVTSRIRRSPEQQAHLDRKLDGLTLYIFPTCPFCIRTRRAMRRLGIDLPLRDARNDPQARAELERGGGKVQVPCLRIQRPDGERWLYESEDIVAYLEQLATSP